MYMMGALDVDCCCDSGPGVAPPGSGVCPPASAILCRNRLPIWIGKVDHARENLELARVLTNSKANRNSKAARNK